MTTEKHQDFITVEISEKNHCIAKHIVGSKGKRYSHVATCRSRMQAEKITNILNGEDDEKQGT